MSNESERSVELSNMKTMLLHMIEQKSDSSKALTKALLNNETLERTKQLDEMLALVKVSLSGNETAGKQYVDAQVALVKHEEELSRKKVEGRVNEV